MKCFSIIYYIGRVTQDDKNILYDQEKRQLSMAFRARYYLGYLQ